uniref:G-protein coupled receptors family 1 profile domain-containing protein n=1 Tax=Laticauda laticaudata TaxID=8630 RepID=A0A8C5S283_LATLA
MKKDNQSCLDEIDLLGFSDFQSMRELLFCLVLMFYLMILMGNNLILILIILNPTLHTPMYFFLWNLSFLEIGYTSTISPNMLMILVSENQTISFWSCDCQMCCFLLFGLAEYCLLCVMSYDHYVAICKPLQYPYIMKYRKCAMFAAVSWAIGVFVSLGQSVSIFTLPFCGSNRINHFFCDSKHVLKLASTDTCTDELSNAFSTCSSHLTVACIFYGTGIVTYIRPSSEYSMDRSRFLGLLYTMVIPNLNPLIYSLRNKEIKAAFKKFVARKQASFMG